MPNTLSVNGTPLYLQVRDYLCTDTDPDAGLVSALGDGINSIFPNNETDGPDADEEASPRPFLLVQSGGMEAADAFKRTWRVAIEIHVDPESGIEQWPGLVQRVKFWLCKQTYRPASDDLGVYRTGFQLERESRDDEAPEYGTRAVQIIFKVEGTDPTSFRGLQGN